MNTHGLFLVLVFIVHSVVQYSFPHVHGEKICSEGILRGPVPLWPRFWVWDV